MPSDLGLERTRLAAKKKFLRFFPKGFIDAKYIAWERGYKWDAHLAWQKVLNKTAFKKLLSAKKFAEIAKLAISIESKTNLLFSFEKMALRDAVKTPASAKQFAEGLYQFIYASGDKRERFEKFITVIQSLPRKQTRVLTWPLVTVFGFIASPKQHIFLKPKVTQLAAKIYGFEFKYQSKPNWETYQSLQKFAALVKKNVIALKPRDYIDLQSFIWTMGSEEYDE